MKYIIAFLCSMLMLQLTACAPPMTPEEQAVEEHAASRQVLCRAGRDCEEKWSRAIQWVTENSYYKIQTQSDNLIQTFGPGDDAFWAFTITRVAQGNHTYLIDFSHSCASVLGCVSQDRQTRASFADAVLGPEFVRPGAHVSTDMWMHQVSVGMKEATEPCRHVHGFKEESNVAYAQCINPRIKKLFIQAGCPYSDLIQFYLDKNMEYAQMEDRKEITVDEGTLKVQKNIEHIKEEGRARDKKQE